MVTEGQKLVNPVTNFPQVRSTNWLASGKFSAGSTPALFVDI